MLEAKQREAWWMVSKIREAWGCKPFNPVVQDRGPRRKMSKKDSIAFLTEAFVR